MRQRRLIHPGTRVRYGHDYVIARSEVCWRARFCSPVFASYLQSATFRHRISGVQGQVQDRKFQLVWVDPRRSQIGFGADEQADVRTDRLFEDIFRITDDRSNVDAFRL